MTTGPGADQVATGLADDLIVRISRSRPDGGGEALAGEDDRWARKRAAIVAAATALFLRQGYQATSTEQIAAAAAVSKQTVYNHFGDKQRLFSDIILGITATAEQFAAGLPGSLAGIDGPDDVEPALIDLARSYLAAVMDPQVLALRRLVIGETNRFPDVAAAYYERAPARVLAVLAAELDGLSRRALLRIADPQLAAEHFAFLVLGKPLDQGMFHTEQTMTADQLTRTADGAVRVFLAAYR